MVFKKKFNLKIEKEKFPVFFVGGKPVLWPNYDNRLGNPVIILSIPKSGTYLTQALFKELGYSPLPVHAMTTYCTDIRFKIQNNLDYEISGTYRLPIETISHLVLPGQVMVSHCGYSRDIVAALKKFKKVYLYRDLREVVLSTAKAFNKH